MTIRMIFSTGNSLKGRYANDAGDLRQTRARFAILVDNVELRAEEP
jgi:hypothetical protein